MGPKSARDEAELVIAAVLNDEEIRHSLYERLAELDPDAANPRPLDLVITEAIARHGLQLVSATLGIREDMVELLAVGNCPIPALASTARMRLPLLKSLRKETP